MDTGPRAEAGYDLALTEVIEDERHYFVCEAGTERGAEVLAELPHAEAGPAEIGAAEAGVARAAANQGRDDGDGGDQGAALREPTSTRAGTRSPSAA